MRNIGVIKIRNIFLLPVLLLATSSIVFAGVLPDERLDALYHSYDGGGVEVTGPSLLVRKGVTSNTSAFYNFYIDNITSASIDVEIGGSRYIEERTEQTLGIDYLHGKTNMSLSFTDSSENDYNANTISFGVSQDFFGDLTTVTMGYSQGNDTVGVRDGADQSEIVRQNYRVGLTQVLTKESTIGFNWETITDEATELNNSDNTLQNPYRSYSFGTVGGTRNFAKEIYPRTRTSNAFTLRGNYYLSYKAAIHAEYRWFQDSWGIRGDTYALNYVHPKGDWVFDFRYRLYSQSKADFYRDMFDYANQFDFMARDKELSTFSSTSFGMSASYEFAKNGWGWIDKGSLNLSYDHLIIDYDDFLDARESVLYGTAAAGEESTYSLEADVIQAFISIWY